MLICKSPFHLKITESTCDENIEMEELALKFLSIIVNGMALQPELIYKYTDNNQV
jgi:hypothetical protein